MKTACVYSLAIAPLTALAVVGLITPLSAAVLFWGTVAGGVHCLAVFAYDLNRS